LYSRPVFAFPANRAIPAAVDVPVNIDHAGSETTTRVIPTDPSDSNANPIRTSLTTWFPDLAPNGWALLGHGYGSMVFEHRPGQVIARISRSAEAGKRLRATLAVLQAVHDRISFAVPRIFWSLDTGQDASAPFGAMAYEKLAGEPLSPATIGQDTEESLTGALIEIHRVPAVGSLARQLPSIADQERFRQLSYAAIRDLLYQHLSHEQFRRVEAWHASSPPLPEQPRLVHGDFWQENLLVDPANGRLTGVLDWENAMLGDPAQDFGPLRHLDRALAKDVLVHYLERTGDDPAAFRERLWWHWQGREFSGIYLALQMHDEAEMDDGIRKLRQGALLDPAAHR
jgi:aminoglycoside phosphotransferase (APT) family kinase protein